MITSASQYIFGKERKRTLLLGLESSGKTAMLHKFKLGEVITSIPSVDFNIETMKYKTNTIISWDLHDQDRQRALWRPYFRNTAYLIFVVDSSDREHIHRARDELHQLLSEAELKNVHLLVYANKKDVPNAMTVAEITNQLDLHSLNNRRWHVEDTCAIDGDGLFEGLDWLTKRPENVK